MAGPDNLHIARESFAAWNAHDVEAFVKRLDTKTIWESDSVSGAVRGHEGARQFFKLYLTAFPDLHLDVEAILPRVRVTSSFAGAPAAPTRARWRPYPPLGEKGASTAAGDGGEEPKDRARLGLLR
jgi:hypothetical protein